jgi:hypothetical protein
MHFGLACRMITDLLLLRGATRGQPGCRRQGEGQKGVAGAGEGFRCRRSRHHPAGHPGQAVRTRERGDGGCAPLDPLDLRLHRRARQRDHAAHGPRLRLACWHPHDPDLRPEQQDAKIPRGADLFQSDRAGAAALRQSRGTRPLFYDPARCRGGKPSNPHFKKVGERLASWVRGLEIDPRVAPNHGWRHRFTSVARFVAMPEDVRHAIQGHASSKVADKYGDTWPQVLQREIEKLPRYLAASG